MIKNVFVFIILLSATGCTLDEKALVGQWKASQFFESGQTVAAALGDVTLNMDANMHYLFKGGYKYSEAGNYSCSMHYLFLNDTTAALSKEKLLKVLYLSNDTLKIRMEDKGKEQVLFLYKVKDQVGSTQ